MIQVEVNIQLNLQGGTCQVLNFTLDSKTETKVAKAQQCNMNIFKYSNIRYSNTNTQFSGYEYIRYLYSANLLRPNIFNIRIRSGCGQLIYLIFVFGQQSGYEYIRYLYSVKSF